MQNYLDSVTKQFLYYKSLGDKTIENLSEHQFYFKTNPEANNIANLICHLYGNMKSRWTDFLTTDGEKPDRNRDEEFEENKFTKEELLNSWQSGWQILFDALKQLTENDLQKIIYIRNQGHTVMEAINRQLAHYPYHVGQIVFIGKEIQKSNWKSLSIPKGQSQAYNSEKFGKEKSNTHFTDEYLKKE